MRSYRKKHKSNEYSDTDDEDDSEYDDTSDSGSESSTDEDSDDEREDTRPKSRLLFVPSPGDKSKVAKGREFEDYFKEGLKRAGDKIKADVEYQKKLKVEPG